MKTLIAASCGVLHRVGADAVGDGTRSRVADTDECDGDDPALGAVPAVVQGFRGVHAGLSRRGAGIDEYGGVAAPVKQPRRDFGKRDHRYRGWANVGLPTHGSLPRYPTIPRTDCWDTWRRQSSCVTDHSEAPPPGIRRVPNYSSCSSTAMKASWGMTTMPTDFMRFLPSFCFSRSLRLRVTSPP